MSQAQYFNSVPRKFTARYEGSRTLREGDVLCFDQNATNSFVDREGNTVNRNEGFDYIVTDPVTADIEFVAGVVTPDGAGKGSGEDVELYALDGIAKNVGVRVDDGGYTTVANGELIYAHNAKSGVNKTAASGVPIGRISANTTIGAQAADSLIYADIGVQAVVMGTVGYVGT